MMLYVKYVTFYKVSIKLSDYKQTIKMFCKIYRRKIALNFLRLLSFVSNRRKIRTKGLYNPFVYVELKRKTKNLSSM
jgi:hypothetical protein